MGALHAWASTYLHLPLTCGNKSPHPNIVGLHILNNTTLCKYMHIKENDRTTIVKRQTYPKGASLAELKHAKHTVFIFHSAVELGQVVVVNAHQLK